MIIAELIGWKQSLLLSGGFGLISSLLLITFLPRKEKEEGTQPEQKTVGKHLELKISDIRRVFLDKSLFLIGLVVAITQIGNNFGYLHGLHFSAWYYFYHAIY